MIRKHCLNLNNLMDIANDNYNNLRAQKFDHSATELIISIFRLIKMEITNLETAIHTQGLV